MRSIRIPAVAAAIIFAIGTAGARGEGSGPVRFGAVLGMTGGSAEQAYSYDVGAKLAIKEINDAGGINGHKIEYVLADDQLDPTQSMAEAKRLLFVDKVNFLLGPMMGAPAQAATPVLNEARVANIAITSSILAPDKGLYSFSILFPISVRAQSAANYITDTKHYKSVALLGDDSSNSRETLNALAAKLKEKGVPSATEIYQFKSPDMTPQLLSLKRNNPDAIFVEGQTAADFVTVLKNIQELNWNVAVIGSATSGSGVRTIVKGAGPEAIKNLVVQVFKGITYCAGDPLGQSPYSKFLARLKAFAPSNFDQLAQQVSGMAYDSVNLFAAAYKATGSTDGPVISKWIEENSSKIEGVSGRFDANAGDHHLIGADSLVFTEQPDRIREDGQSKRAGC